MKVKNVLLTGAGGKIGQAVLPELVKAGYAVRALEYTDGLQVPREGNVEVVVGDLRDPSLAPKLIEDMDVVIHLENVKENKQLFMDTNIDITRLRIESYFWICVSNLCSRLTSNLPNIKFCFECKCLFYGLLCFV